MNHVGGKMENEVGVELGRKEKGKIVSGKVSSTLQRDHAQERTNQQALLGSYRKLIDDSPEGVLVWKL